MSAFVTFLRTRLAAGLAALAATVAMVVTGTGTADAAVTSLVGADARCYSAYGSPGVAGLNMHDGNAAAYWRAARLEFRNDGQSTWRPATAWFYFQPGAGALVAVGQWHNPASRASWHQYRAVTYALVGGAWQYQGAKFAYATNGLTPGGTESANVYGWCYA